MPNQKIKAFRRAGVNYHHHALVGLHGARGRSLRART
jgi:hypothetical protein